MKRYTWNMFPMYLFFTMATAVFPQGQTEERDVEIEVNTPR
jgi:hypothetical protein